MIKSTDDYLEKVHDKLRDSPCTILPESIWILGGIILLLGSAIVTVWTISYLAGIDWTVCVPGMREMFDIIDGMDTLHP